MTSSLSDNQSSPRDESTIEIRIPLGQPIALGRTAEIYAWQNATILKLFHEWFSLDDIQYEMAINRAVHVSGLPVPEVGEVVQVNGRYGLIYERVDGIPMMTALQQRPWRLFGYARQLAGLHARMHETDIEIALPAQRQRLVRKIEQAVQLPAETRARLLTRLEGLPDGKQICHGDFHVSNVLLTPDRAIIIDWMDATLGNPLADVARTNILVMGAIACGQIPAGLSGSMVRLFQGVYLRHYFRLRPGGQEEYRRWLPIMAAARLEENIPEVESWLIEQAGK